MFARKPGITAGTWRDLDGHRIGIVRGVGTSEDATRGLKHVYAFTSLEQAMRMPAHGAERKGSPRSSYWMDGSKSACTQAKAIGSWSGSEAGRA